MTAPDREEARAVKLNVLELAERIERSAPRQIERHVTLADIHAMARELLRISAYLSAPVGEGELRVTVTTGAAPSTLQIDEPPLLSDEQIDAIEPRIIALADNMAVEDYDIRTLCAQAKLANRPGGKA